MDERRRGAESICAVLRDAGHEALLAGGCVRDLLLGEPPQDFDVATSARPDDVMALFEKTVPVGVEYGTVIVILPEGEFEVTTFRRDGPYLDGRHPAHVTFTNAEADARRRDFTINALFLDPSANEVRDFVGGQADIEAGLVRAVGDPLERFEEDYLRLLRAIRFAARLGYEIEENTWRAMRELAVKAAKTSPERIRDELLKCLTEGGAARAFRLMDECGMLGALLPEIEAMKGVEQPAGYHPEGDVFQHMLLTLEHLDGYESPSPALALGVLLHDVGKPVTQTFEDRIRFNHHDKVGAGMAERICRRLRLSRRDIERVTWLVSQHMRLADMPGMRESKRKRFAREPGFPELLELARIDCLASHGDVSTVQWIEEYLTALPAESMAPPPLITGKDLIAMGYAPGPLFGQILSAVEDAQLEGDLQTKEEAMAFVRRKWPLAGQEAAGRDDT